MQISNNAYRHMLLVAFASVSSTFKKSFVVTYIPKFPLFRLELCTSLRDHSCPVLNQAIHTVDLVESRFLEGDGQKFYILSNSFAFSVVAPNPSPSRCFRYWSTLNGSSSNSLESVARFERYQLTSDEMTFACFKGSFSGQTMAHCDCCGIF